MSRRRTRLTMNCCFVCIIALCQFRLARQAVSDQPQKADSSIKPQEKKEVVDEKTIRVLIAELGSDDFEVREAANKRLAGIGEPALPLLQKAATESTDAEVRQRASNLAKVIEVSFFSLVRVLDGHPKARLKWVTRVAVSHDGKEAVSAGYGDGLRTWNVATGKELKAFGNQNSNYWALAISPNGKRLLAVGDGSVATIFNFQTGKELQSLKGHTDAVWGAAWLADGKHVLTGSWDNSIRVWDADSGKEVRKFDGVRDKVRCLALSPDGKIAATGHFTATGSPGRVRLWDVEKGKEIRALDDHKQEISSVAFSPDGKAVLSSSFDSTLRLWEVATGIELKRFEGHPARVEFAAFTSDGKRVISCGDVKNPTIRVWDVGNGKQILESVEIVGGASCVAVLPNSGQCLSTGKDGVVRLWELKK